MTASARSLRHRLLIGASVATLVVAGTAQAQNLGAGRSANPAAAVAQATQSAAQRNAAAQAAAARTRAAFDQASRVRQQMDAAQVAAREAARVAQSNVPNGLGAGGLQVADGAIIDPGAFDSNDPRLGESNLWLGANGPTQRQTANGRTEVTVEQTQQKAILTWDSFNVGRETDLVFNQQGNQEWVALNRINDVTADPSRILGNIRADGQVYLINRNGIIFGGTSQINVHSIIASSMDIWGSTSQFPAGDYANPMLDRNRKFLDGLLNFPSNQTLTPPVAFGTVPVRGPNGELLDENNQPIPGSGPAPLPAAVVVEAGARLEAGELGHAALLGGTVINRGQITAHGGQVILAAGEGVTLNRNWTDTSTPTNAQIDPDLRGFRVEMRGLGRVENSENALILADRGNITLGGFEIRNAGLLAATTGAEANGTITIDAVTLERRQRMPGNPTLQSFTQRGSVVFDAGSRIDILPDTADVPVVGEGSFRPSKIEVDAERIFLLGGSEIYAPGAEVVLNAAQAVARSDADNSRLYIDTGARIDLSGLAGVEASVSDFEIEAQLRANELRDSPVNRDGALRGRTVYFDARRGGNLTADGEGVADLSGYYDLIERDVDQFMTTGGTLRLAGNEIIAREGSTIDLSGGSIDYAGGFVRSSRLIDAFGRLVPIEQAVAGMPYVGVEGDFVVNHSRWGVTETFVSRFARTNGQWEAAHTEGRSAGTLDLTVGTATVGSTTIASDAFRIFDGEIVADVMVGDFQREAPSAGGATDITRAWRERPSGASLIMGGLPVLSPNRDPISLGGNVTIGDGRPALAEDFRSDTALDHSNAYQHRLSTDWFDGDLFTNVTIRSGFVSQDPGRANPAGILTIGEGVTVNLGNFGSFAFYGRQAQIDGVIRASGGSVDIQAVQAPATDPAIFQTEWRNIAEGDRPLIRLGATGAIDVSGNWINSHLDGGARQAVAIDGGEVTLVGYNIELESGSRVDVSGGGYLNVAGDRLTPGDAGAITIDSSIRYTNTGTRETTPGIGRLVLEGELAGYALGRGGRLIIDTTDDVLITDNPVLADGMLGAGEEAPREIRLAEDTVIPAGATLPISFSYIIDRIEPGATIETPSTPNFGSSPVTIAADWTVPDGLYLYDSSYAVEYGPGSVIPAGTRIVDGFGSVSPGYVIPAEVFPGGFPVSPITVEVPSGPVTVDTVVPAGTVVPQGTVFEQDVAVAGIRNFTSEFFTRGGFADYAISGARGMTITEGTIVTPSIESLQMRDLGRSIASGARLVDVAERIVLPDVLHGPMSLTLSTVPIDPSTGRLAAGDRIADYSGSADTMSNVRPRHPGELLMEQGAEIRMRPESTVRLGSLADIFIDGLIDTPGGTIDIAVAAGSVTENNAIRLGGNARLLARGYQWLTPDGWEGRRSVEAGGEVRLGRLDRATALSSFLAVMTDRGSVIDVSGLAAIADLLPGTAGQGERGPRYAATEVDGAAGSVHIEASAGSIAGELRMTPGGETGHGGVLNIQNLASGSPEMARTIIREALAPEEGLVGPDSEFDTTEQVLTLFADRLNAAGADELLVGVSERGSRVNAGAILFDGDVSLETRRSLQLSARVLGMASDQDSSVRLSSAYVRLSDGYSNTNLPAPLALASPGLADLTVSAEIIDIARQVNLGCGAAWCATNDVAAGFGNARFEATGDIRLVVGDATDANATNRGLFSGGRLEFDAAQVYVTSRNAVTSTQNAPGDRPESNPGFLVQSAELVRFTSNGAPAPAPLSFGERLTVRAPVIEQGGVLRAPQGQIRLEGSQSVTLLPGSLTSASLEGLTVPFGALTIGAGFLGYHQPGATPTKSVRLDAPDVAVEDGAIVDVSGGGDLLGWSFGAGNGGSRNILARENTERFAILPSLGTGTAPVHVSGADLNDPRLNVGDTIYLDGIPGLRSGYYTLLPAHYALLEGGLLVEPLGGAMAGSAAPMHRPDGSIVVSGFRAVAGTPIRDQAFSSFLVMDQKTFGQYSEITRHSFNDYARELGAAAGITARTPFDAGSVILGATQTLRLEGQGRFGANEGGLLGNLDISAQNIAVVGGGADGPEGYVSLDAQGLSAFGAASVLIGGVRSVGATGTAVTVNAENVIVANDSTSPLTGQELILAGRNQVVVEDGAVLVAEGDAMQDPNSLLLTGDGALLRLSSGDRVGVVRTGTTGANGDLLIGAGASLSASGSLSLDSVRTLDLAESAVIEADQLDLATVRVNLGEVPENEAGTTLALDMIERLAAASDLLIRGHESITLFGGLELGSRNSAGEVSLGAITLDTAQLQGRSEASGATARITAGTLTLRNSGSARDAAPESGSSTFALDVDSLVLGPGQVGIAGYGQVSGNAGVVEARGNGGLVVAGGLDLASGRLTAASGADYDVRASGDLAFTQAVAPTVAVEAFGGRLALSGRNVLVDTSVALPAGSFEVTASGDLQLGQNARFDLRGAARDFRDAVRFAPGGSIILTSAGDLSIATGALLDVSGSDRGGNAGRIEIAAGESASIQGDLRANAVAGGSGGQFGLDAGTVDGFSALNALLNGGGFDSSREIRLRDQSIVLAAGERVEAHQVTLRSDRGEVRIAGTIAAAGTSAAPDGGVVRLVGGAGVALADTARIEAAAAPAIDGEFAPTSGKVELAAEGGAIDVAAGALVDLSGGREGGGEILVRANRVGDGIAVNRLDGEVRGARSRSLVGMASYDSAEVDSAFAHSMRNAAVSWLANAPAFSGWQTGAGMIVRSEGDLRVAGDIDLAGLLGPGYLGLIAVGDIEIGASISDGFVSAARDAALMTGNSSKYDFEAGRDIVLNAGAMVRTGTGDIRLEAARDLVLSANSSVLYTAGSRTMTEAGFTPPSGRPIGEFPTLGGDIAIAAGRDILAPITRQTASAWLFRYGATNWDGSPADSTVAQQTSWSVVYRNFESGVGALGGGNVAVRAGRDIQHLSVALPTTGHLTTPVGSEARAADLHVRGGGDLDLSAGRHLLGGVFMLGRGHGEVQAGGRIGPSAQMVNLRRTAALALEQRNVAPLFGLMDATLDVTGGSSVEIEGVFDPMMQGQICENLTGCTGSVTGSSFHGFTERTAFDALSVSGAVTYRNNNFASVDLSLGSGAYEVRMVQSGAAPLGSQHLVSMLNWAPGTLRFTAFDGDVNLRPGITNLLSLAPTDAGTIELIAQDDIRISYSSGTGSGLIMQDVAPEFRRGPLNAFGVTVNRTSGTQFANKNQVAAIENNFERGFTPSHSGDPTVARIYALTGSVCQADISTACVAGVTNAFRIELPKALNLYAGRDLVSASLVLQHNQGSDFSAIAAGRDIYSPNIVVAGDGALFVDAGRHIDLGTTGGRIISGGNVTNSAIAAGTNLALPADTGADLYLTAGTQGGTDYDGFGAIYLDPANVEGVVRTYLPELAAYMEELGHSGLSGAALLEAFNALPETSRHPFLQSIFFSELRETGLDYNDPESPRFRQYDRGYEAVARLFPTNPDEVEERGNILLNANSVETQAGGDITILAPYGRVDIGRPVTDANSNPNAGGTVTRRGGDIRIMADDDIALFTSRLFTLQGGDITMWTSNGDITAGAGSRTSVTQVPLRYTMNNDGYVSLDVFGLQTGAGIGVLDALDGRDEDREPSRLDLLAFRGEVNAGDAGIRVVGDINIAALRVVNAANIEVSGEAVGIPEVPAVNMGALNAASAATSAVINEAAQLAERSRPQVRAEMPTILNVRFLGFGE